MEHLIFIASQHSRRFETTSADWVILDGNTSAILEISYAQLIAANIHDKAFGKLIKDLSSPLKVLNMPSLFSINGVSCFLSLGTGFLGLNEGL